jgi:hypothetical protein
MKIPSYYVEICRLLFLRFPHVISDTFPVAEPFLSTKFSHLLKKILSFYDILWFTTPRHCILFWAGLIKPTSSHPVFKICSNIILLCTRTSSKLICPVGFTWRILQIMKLSIFLSLTFKYSHWNSVLRHSHFMFFSYGDSRRWCPYKTGDPVRYFLLSSYALWASHGRERSQKASEWALVPSLSASIHKNKFHFSD